MDPDCLDAFANAHTAVSTAMSAYAEHTQDGINRMGSGKPLGEDFSQRGKELSMAVTQAIADLEEVQRRCAE